MNQHEALPSMRNQAPDSVIVLRALLERRASDEPLLANARAARATTSVVPLVAGEGGGVTVSERVFGVCPVHAPERGECWDGCLPERAELFRIGALFRQYWCDRKRGVLRRQDYLRRAALGHGQGAS